MESNHEQDKARALERVRKMLRLANDAAATEGERDNAMRMAYATLAKYNLSMAEASAPKDDREEQTMVLYTPLWMRRCSVSIAKLFFCEYYYSQRRGERNSTHHFIGRQANAVTAREMSLYVIKSIRNEAGRRRRETGADGPWETAFINGATYAIAQRCHELRRQAEETSREPSTGTSLVLASVYASELAANQAWLAARGVTLGKSRSKSRGVKDAAGYHAGRSFGETVNLARQVGKASGGNSPRLK